MSSVRCLTALGLLVLAGCGHVPVTSLLRLAKIDFASTDPAQLRVAVKLPETLRPLPRSLVLRITVRKNSGQELKEGFVLEESLAPAEALPLRSELETGTHIAVYQISAAELPRLMAFRTTALAQGGSGGGLAIQPEACRTGVLPLGPLLISTYLRTVETGGYVPLTRAIDLRNVTPSQDIATAIPLCE